MPRKHPNGLVSFVNRYLQSVIHHDCFGMAAQLSYFFFLSLFPLLIVLVTLISYLPYSQDDLLGIIRDFAPKQPMVIIERTLEEVMTKSNSGLLSIGIIGTLWSGSSGMRGIVKAMNRAYDVNENRSFITIRVMSIFLTILLLFVILLVLLLPVFGKQIGYFIFLQLGVSDQFVQIWNYSSWLISAIVLFVVFIGVYFFSPNKKIQCRSVVPGSLFATFGWMVVSWMFSYYVANFGDFSAIYGSIGGIIVMLIWFYLTAVILILGGELNAFISEETKC
ncbi:YihY/virulence factor BrkB family protein [Aeribacillus pallidus]|uniref:YihY/virulence factor BrkB family protein n=1 Tax=Aeribacillus pallidus TaxID=33936 RepID=UPI003D22E594